MSMSNVVAPSEGALPDEFSQAFQQLQKEIEAVSDRDLIAVNLDVPSAVATVLGSWPEIVALREEMKGIAGFDLARFDKLRSYALALGHAHAVYRAAVGSPDGVAELAEEMAQLREVLHADAMALAKRGLLAEASVSKLRSGLGYKNLAFDVASLVTLFRERWESVSSKTAVTSAELDRAAQMAQKLLTVVGVKEQSPAAISAASRSRQKAFTLFAREYDEVRRLVGFLRWHQGDAEEIAPSLYKGRGGRSAASSEAEPEKEPAPGVPQLAGTGAGLGSATIEVPVPAGLPGSSPFAR